MNIFARLYDWLIRRYQARLQRLDEEMLFSEIREQAETKTQAESAIEKHKRMDAAWPDRSENVSRAADGRASG